MTDLEKYRNRIYCNRWRLKRLNNGWQASTFVLPRDVMRSVKQVRDILMKKHTGEKITPVIEKVRGEKISQREEKGIK